MKTKLVRLLALALAAAPAHAKTFRYADQGDALSMDPHMFNEAVQLSFTGNMYEGLTGRGKKLETILAEMQMVAEGVWTTRALFGPESEARGIPMPIAEQVNAILFEGQDPRKAVIELMRREQAGEMDGLGTASVV